MNEWVSLLQTFGLATAIIAFMGLCIWKASGWIGENVIKPVVDRWLKLLDALIASIVKQGEALTKVGSVMEQLGRTLERMGQHTIQSMEVLEQISRGVSNLQRVDRVVVREADKVEVHSTPPKASPNETPTSFTSLPPHSRGQPP